MNTLMHRLLLLVCLCILAPCAQAYYEPGSGRFLSPDPFGHEASMSLYDYAGGDPVNYLDADGRAVIQAWEQAQQNLINQGGFLNNAGAYGISLGITALNTFSIGGFARNDALVDLNLAGRITDSQLYGGMAINSGAAAAATLTGGAIAPLAGRALVAAGSPALMYVGSGAAAGAATAATDVAVRRAGYAANDIAYDGSVRGDLAYIGGSVVFGGVVGGVTYAIVRTGEGVVYQRVDGKGNVGEYYGQARSPERFDARMGEHQAKNPNAFFEFEQVNSARPGNALDFMEQFYITGNGGSRTQNSATPLSNYKRAMSDARFWEFLFGTTAPSGQVGAGGASAVLGKKP